MTGGSLSDTRVMFWHNNHHLWLREAQTNSTEASRVCVSPPLTLHSYNGKVPFIGPCYLPKFWDKKPKASTKVTLQEPPTIKTKDPIECTEAITIELCCNWFVVVEVCLILIKSVRSGKTFHRIHHVQTVCWGQLPFTKRKVGNYLPNSKFAIFTIRLHMWVGNNFNRVCLCFRKFCLCIFSDCNFWTAEVRYFIFSTHTYILTVSRSGHCIKVKAKWINFIITVRNVIAARLCFHRHLSFCSQGGGGCVADTPNQTLPPGHTPQADTPWTDTPRADTPLAQCMLGYPPPTGGHCSGRYASYWNAFLFNCSLFKSEGQCHLMWRSYQFQITKMSTYRKWLAIYVFHRWHAFNWKAFLLYSKPITY